MVLGELLSVLLLESAGDEPSRFVLSEDAGFGPLLACAFLP